MHNTTRTPGHTHTLTRRGYCRPRKELRTMSSKLLLTQNVFDVQYTYNDRQGCISCDGEWDIESERHTWTERERERRGKSESKTHRLPSTLFYRLHFNLSVYRVVCSVSNTNGYNFAILSVSLSHASTRTFICEFTYRSQSEIVDVTQNGSHRRCTLSKWSFGHFDLACEWVSVCASCCLCLVFPVICVCQ